MIRAGKQLISCEQRTPPTRKRTSWMAAGTAKLQAMIRALQQLPHDTGRLVALVAAALSILESEVALIDLLVRLCAHLGQVAAVEEGDGTQAQL